MGAILESLGLKGRTSVRPEGRRRGRAEEPRPIQGMQIEADDERDRSGRRASWT